MTAKAPTPAQPPEKFVLENYDYFIWDDENGNPTGGWFPKNAPDDAETPATLYEIMSAYCKPLSTSPETPCETPQAIKRLEAIIERDRTQVAEGVTAIRDVLQGRDWLTEGRGPYEWNDDNWHKEFAEAAKEIYAALKPLEKIAADLSDSPKTQAEVESARAALRSSGMAAPRRRFQLCDRHEKLIGSLLPEDWCGACDTAKLTSGMGQEPTK